LTNLYLWKYECVRISTFSTFYGKMIACLVLPCLFLVHPTKADTKSVVYGCLLRRIIELFTEFTSLKLIIHRFIGYLYYLSFKKNTLRLGKAFHHSRDPVGMIEQHNPLFQKVDLFLLQPLQNDLEYLDFCKFPASMH
jgi:hypothetical protein